MQSPPPPDESARKAALIAGFTLIEMSIVLVVIGLIVGGILVGQNLIAAAAIRSTIAQMDRYTTAANAFHDKYSCLPGDCATAVALGLGTTGGPGDNGNGNGQVFSSVAMFAPSQGPSEKESFNFWYHLQQANMIEGGYTGYPAGGFTTFSGNFTGYAPVTKIRSTVFINAMSITDTSQGDEYFDNSFVISAGGISGGGGQLNGGMTAAEAYAIDTKIDDGFPTTGSVQVMYPYPGPRVNPNDPACDYQNGVPWLYDLQGLWASYALQIHNTPHNPGQLGCLLAITKRF